MAKENKKLKRERKAANESTLAGVNRVQRQLDRRAQVVEDVVKDDRVAIPMQTHMDGDPKPRPNEIEEWNSIRRRKGQDEIMAMILLPDETQQDEPFPGYQHHDWKIYERDGEVVCEPEEISIEIVSDATIATEEQNNEKDDTLTYMLSKEGLRLRHGKNKEGEDTVWTEQINEELPEPPPLAPHTARRSHWQEVVDLQDEMIRFWYTKIGREYGKLWGEHIAKSTDEAIAHAQQKSGLEPRKSSDTSHWALNLDAINRACLQQASPIWVSPEVQDTIEYAANHETFAMELLTREDVFPSMHGFCVFPRPFVVNDSMDKKLAFRAIAWMPVGQRGEITYDAEYRTSPNEASGILLIAYSHRDDHDDYPEIEDLINTRTGSDWYKHHPLMTLCYVTPWTFSRQTPIDMTGSNLAKFCAIVQTMWRFAKQTVVVPETTRLPRAQRKRAERKNLISDVIVVKLRRKKYTPPKDHVPEKMDIDFRYWVGLDEGGFWRNQWYPKRQAHEQIWISPYLKGPEDAPIRYKPLHAFEITQ